MRKRFVTRKLPRRTFLGVSASAGLAALAGVPASANAFPRIGVIGCGQRGTTLLDSLLRRSDVRVTAVCDVWRVCLEAAASRSRAATYSAWQDLVTRDHLDAVVIATPDHLHAPIAVAAMQAGKDVYCEPPMALSAEDARTFRDCANAAGRVVQIGAHEPFEGQWRTARNLIKTGRLGKVLRCHAAVAYPLTSDSAPSDAPPHAQDVDWPAFLGTTSDHPFDAQRFLDGHHHWDYSAGSAANGLFGNLAAFLLATGLECPVRVSAAGGVYAPDGREVPDSLMMTAVYSEGTSVVLAASPVRRVQTYPVIRGERASLFCEGNGLRLVPQGEPDDAGSLIPATPSGDSLTDWIGCVRTRRQPICGVDLGYRTTLAMGMAMGAYRERKTVSSGETV